MKMKGSKLLAPLILLGGTGVLLAGGPFNFGPKKPAQPVFEARVLIIQPASATTNYWDTLVTGNPQLLLEEDFTDGSFDDFGALNPITNQNNWAIFGGTVGWKLPQNRPNIPLALARRPKEAGAAWEGAIWKNPLTYYYLDKRDDISVLEFEGFSDAARRIETFGIEVAMLEERSILCPPPDYCHDLSWESMLCFSNDRSQPNVQLETNTENTGNRLPNGVRFTHYTGNGGYADDTYLGGLWKSRVLWRPNLALRKVNFEQWGAANYADAYLDTFFTSKLEPENTYAPFNEVQVTLFRADANIGSNNSYKVRTGISNDSAQVGVTYVKVGITKKADFNLDYRIDAQDVSILTRNLGRVDTTTLLQGDATNDQKIDINDALPLTGLWSGPATSDSVYVIGQYNPATGEITLTCKNLNFLKIVSTAGQLTGAAPNFSGILPEITFDQDTMVGFYSSAPITLNQYSLGNIAASGINPTNLKLVVNYNGSKKSDGFVADFSGLNLVISTQIAKAQYKGKRLFKVGDESFQIPTQDKSFNAYIIDPTGKVLLNQTLRADQDLAKTRLASGVRILYLADPKTGKKIFTQTFIIP